MRRRSVASTRRWPSRSSCQRLREAEREQVFGQFAHREGEIITGTVSRVEPRGVILDVGREPNRVDAILATTEQSAMEHYRIGQHVKAYVLEVRRTTQGPADLRQPHPQGLPAPALRARGARDPRRHGRDQGHRPRGRQPQQGRRRQPPGGPRPGRCHGRPAGRSCAGRRRRAGRREDRHHPVVGGPGDLRRQRAQPSPGGRGAHRRGELASPTSRSPSGCSRWPSGAKARMRAWPRN